MKAKHIYEDGVYLLRNTAVARNPLFSSERTALRFREACHEYLGSLCEIVAISLNSNQWELIVKMKNRFVFEEFYKEKHNLNKYSRFLIPESGYIFSQQMANLQSGFVKHFNWLNGRVGSLFYRRYEKHLIENELELNMHIERINNREFENPHRGYWSKGMDVIKGGISGSYGEGRIERYRAMELNEIPKNDLEAWFQILPFLQINDPIPRYLRTIFKILQALSK